MIYVLFTISMLTYFLLKSVQAYYEYFSISLSSTNDKVKARHIKNNFPWTPKIIVWIIFKSSKPNWIIKREKSVERKLSIVKSFSHFTCIFCIVAFVFSLLQLWLDTSTQLDIAKTSIFKIEETQFKIKEFISHFKFTFGYDVLILFLFITLASSFPLLEQYKVNEKLKQYNKAVKSVIYFFTISTSFTFFGNRFASQEEGRIGLLEIHKLQIIEDNKLLLKKINKKITNEIVCVILANPQVVEVLDKIEEVKKRIDETKQKVDYINFISVASPNFVRNLTISSFENKFNSMFNFESAFNKSEDKFQSNYKRNTSSESDYYRSKEESDYSSFKKENKWYNESSFTQSASNQAAETFASASENVTSKSAKYYSKYKEPIEKLIKKGYSNTGGKWVINFFEALGVDLPFLDELIDPIINEPIEDYITKKTETFFKSCTENNSEAVKSELSKCSKEFQTIFNTKVSNSRKFAKLKKQLSTELASSREVLSQTKSEIAIYLNKAEKCFQQLKAKDEWERIRTTFYRQLRKGEFTQLPSNMEDIYRSAFEEWYDFLKVNKSKLYFQNEKNLEPVFIDYTRQNPKLTAAWGYVVLSKRKKEIKAMFPSSNHLRPYEALQYYYSKNGIVGENFAKIYTKFVDEFVGELCP